MNDKLDYKMTVIPALPGFDIASLVHDPFEFEFVPIVAWVIEVSSDKSDDAYRFAGGVATPICTDYVINSSSETIAPYRGPDGSIHFFDGPIFKKGQEDKALAYAVERWEERQKRTKAINAAAETSGRR
jgi:hypothetical protein